MAHIILTGATGLAGSAVLQSALSSPSVSKITILSRSPVPAASSNPKANVILHQDFTSYPAELLSQLQGATACIWAQGKSSVGMTEADYRKLTVDYPIAAAQAFTKLPIDKHSNGGFKFVHTSGMGADPTMTSRVLFARVKGEAETILSRMAEEREGFVAYNVRPAGIDPGKDWKADRKQSMMEKVVYGAFGGLMRSRFLAAYNTPVEKLGDVMVGLAVGDGKPVEGTGVSAGGFTLENEAIRRLAGI